MNNKIKFMLTSLVVAILASTMLVFSTEGQGKSYYNGAAYHYKGTTYVASTNTGYLEVFKLQDNDLIRLHRSKSTLDRVIRRDEYTAVNFREENGQLFVYAASGRRLYKYALSQGSNLVLVDSLQNNTWDWVGSIVTEAGYLATIGSKGVNIWNNNLMVLDSFKVINKTNPHNVRLSDDHFIFNLDENKLNIFDQQSRQVVRQIGLNTSGNIENRQVAYNSRSNQLFVIDDAAVKQFGLDGGLYKSLSHDSGYGYDAQLSANKDYIYVTNGTSIAKLKSSDFSFVAGFENRDLGIDNSWAMGMEVIYTGGVEQVVVFNNSNILVLDSSLNEMASFTMTDPINDGSTPADKLFLALDKNRAPVYGEVMLRGGGYDSNEPIRVNFADRTYWTVSDGQGRFEIKLYVPAVEDKRVDIRVRGIESKQDYSIAFTIEQ